MLVERIAGRRTCRGCKAGYHVQFKAPQVEDVCDLCGDTLLPREDDRPEVAQDRISTYYEQTAPVLTWMRDNARNIVDIDATQNITAVRDAILAALEQNS